MTTSPIVGSPHRWSRDFALMGLLTGTLAPFLVIFDPVFAASAGVAAGLSGAVLGAMAGWTMERVRGTVPLAVLWPAMAVVGSLWGAFAGTLGGVVGGAVGLVFGLEAVPLGFIVGGCSGMVAMALFFPLYLFASVKGRTEVALGLAVLGAPAMGWAGAMALLGSLYGMWLFALPVMMAAAVWLDRSERHARQLVERSRPQLVLQRLIE